MLMGGRLPAGLLSWEVTLQSRRERLLLCMPAPPCAMHRKQLWPLLLCLHAHACSLCRSFPQAAQGAMPARCKPALG